MEIENNAGTLNTQTRDNIRRQYIKKIYIHPAEKQTRDLRDGDSIKTGMQATRLDDGGRRN